MDVNTGHLIALPEDQPPPEGYTEVPPHLNRAARRKLGKNREAMVSLTSGGALSRWAAQQRKTRRKIAKASRRRNRGR